MAIEINKNYGEFPFLAYTPFFGFFLQRARLAEISRNMYAAAEANQDVRVKHPVILIDLKNKINILQKGQRRSLLTIALCIGCIALNFYPFLFLAIGVGSAAAFLYAKKLISYNQRTLTQYEAGEPNDNQRQLHAKLIGMTNPFAPQQR